MKKPLSNYSTKGQGLEIKDFDEGSRSVAVYLAKFDVIDSDFDIIRPGSFSKSIQERGPASPSNRKIAFLRHHNWEKQIGKFTELAEDQNGLFAVGSLGNSTEGSDAFNDYKDGIILEHSIGFKYIADKINFVEDPNFEIGGFYEVKELALWEGSAVTFGANQFTNVIEVAKAEGRLQTAEKISGEIDVIGKALANGKGTDDRLYNLEMKLKYLNTQLLTLATNDPFNKQSLKSEPNNSTPFKWSEVIQNINY